MAKRKGGKRGSRPRRRAAAPNPQRPATKAAAAPVRQGAGRRLRATVPPRTAAGALALLAACVVCYTPALLAGFVWDDEAFFAEPLVREWSGLFGIWFSPGELLNEGHYWPIVYTSFWLEHKLWGFAPFGFHLVNVLLHAANTLLIWRLLARLEVPGAWLAAAVFAVHPLHVESVAWVIERKDLLSAAFYLGAILAWLRFDEAPQRWRDYLLALALFAAALLSKSIVVTLPVALLILRWWKAGRVRALDWARVAPFFVVAVGIGAADLAFYQGREVLDLGYTFAERLLIAGQALWFYVGKLLWPVELPVIYPLWNIHTGSLLAWACLAGCIAAAAALWLARQRLGRGPLAGALYFAVTLSPTLGFVDYGYMQYAFVADRFQYLAGLGLITILVGMAVRGASGQPRPATLAAVALSAGALAALGTATWRHASVFHDDATLFSHIVSLNPAARDAHLNLGKALIERRRPQEGLAASRIAAAQRPESSAAHMNVGLALHDMGRHAEAEEHMRRAAELAPSSWHARQNLGEVRRAQGRYPEAIEAYRAALELQSSPLSLVSLGMSQFGLDRFEEALATFRQALDHAPMLPPDVAASTHAYMGRAARGLDRLGDAAAHFERALAIDPRHPPALDHFASLRFRERRFADALALYRRLVEADPNSAAAHANVGAALYYLERHEEALGSFDQALALDPDYRMASAGRAEAQAALNDAAR